MAAPLEAEMRLEGLVTCRKIVEDEARDLTLVGVFQDLSDLPTDFGMYFDLRPGAEDSATLRVRVRRASPTRQMVFESAEELVLSPMIEAYAVGLTVTNVRIPVGRLVVEVFIDAGLAASRAINFKP